MVLMVVLVQVAVVLAESSTLSWSSSPGSSWTTASQFSVWVSQPCITVVWRTLRLWNKWNGTKDSFVLSKVFSMKSQLGILHFTCLNVFRCQSTCCADASTWVGGWTLNKVFPFNSREHYAWSWIHLIVCSLMSIVCKLWLAWRHLETM